MSAAGNLDLRLPIGGLFTVNGLILAVYGLVTAGNGTMYERSEGMNINLIWGIVMLVFGIIMLVGAMRGRRTLDTADDTAQGRATEQREHDRGLER